MGFATCLRPLLAAGLLAAVSTPAEDTFRFVPATVRVTEGVGAEAVLTIVRQGTLDFEASVDVFTDNDIALAGINYTAVSNTLSFAAGVGTNTVAIPILDNGNVRSGVVDFFVRLRNPSPGTALGAPANATVVILEDDIETWACGASVYLVPTAGAWAEEDENAANGHQQDDGGLLWEVSGESVRVDTFESADAEEFLVPETAFLFLEGGTSGLSALRDFLAANRLRLENWVRAGGHLLVCASPDSETAILPFGALVRGGTVSDSTVCVDPDDALFSLYDTVGTDWTPVSNSLHTAEAILDLSGAGDGFQSRLLGAGGGVLVASASIGCGSVTYATLRPASHIECVADGRADTGLQLWRNLVFTASDVTDPLYVTECPVFEMAGIVGDLASFSPAGKVFAVQNWASDMGLSYSASCEAEWIVLAPASPSGTIPANSQVSLTVLPAPGVADLPVGEYESALVVRNEDTGRVLRRPLRLVVNPIPGTLALPTDSIAPFDDLCLPFGAVPLGTSVSATITLVNNDPDHGVRIRNIYYAGDDEFNIYVSDISGFEVPAAGTVTLSVVYKPTRLGDHAAVFGFITDDPATPSLEFRLTGTALVDTLVLDVAEPMVFSGHPGSLPEPTSYTCTITNRASETASWRLRRLPEWLSADPASGTVPAGGSATFSIAPTSAASTLAEGRYTASISFTNLTTRIEQPFAAELTLFTTPQLDVSPPSLAFTNIVGASSPKPLVISNLPEADANLDYSLFLVCKGTPERAGGDSANISALGAARNTPRGGFAATPVSEGGEDKCRELLVRFDGPAAARRAAVSRDGAARRAFAAGRTLRTRPDTAVIPMPEGLSIAEAMAELRATPGVRTVQPNYRYHALAVPNDPRFPSQWGLANVAYPQYPGVDIHATNAWDIATSAGELIVAVIDSGADLNHPDLVDNLWTNPEEIPDNGIDDDGNGFVDDVHGVDFINGTGSVADPNGHGTHCCGIIGARGDNGVGVCGVCWRVRLMPLRFLDSKGYGTTADAVDAIEYAIAHGASVINASWGGEPDEDDALLKEAIERASDAGVLFVCAAGNDSMDIDETPSLPASFDCPNIVTVINLSYTGRLGLHSNWGAVSAHIAAPGAGVLSTYRNGDYATLSGTSMACPHVAGAAALIRSLHPDLSPADVKALLLDTVTKSADFDGLCSSGGYLDLHAALGTVLGTNAWLATDADGGVLAPGESASLSLTASAATLAPGVYHAFVHIRSNDPETPEVVVEVTQVVLAPSRITDADWRARYGLPDDDSEDGADFDADGFTNYEEWLLGTDPTDAESAFRILGMEMRENGVQVIWAGVSNRLYRVLSADDLQSPFAPIADNIPGTAPATSYLDDRPPSPSNRFYRIALPQE